MTEQQMIDALQRLHELTQQNSPESAGTVWIELMRDIVWTARATSASVSVVQVIERAMQNQDIEPRALLIRI